MHRESMIPDVPDELLRTEGINSPALYTTQQYNASMHSKSKSKLGSVGQYPAFNERRNPIFGPAQPSPHLVISNNYVVHHQPSSSAQPLQMLQETRAKSPHRMQGHSFSPAVHGSALKGTKENQLGSHIPAQSEHCQPRRITQPIFEQHSQVSQQQQLSSNMLNLMREQLELATKAYSARFGEELRRNNEYDCGMIQRELIRMERRIKELEQLVVARQNQLSRLKEMFDQSVSARVGDGRGNPRTMQPQEMMRSYDYLAGRMRDIELKLRIIIDGLQFRETEERKIGRVETKIIQLRDEFMKLQVGRFRTIEAQIMQYFNTKDSMLAALEGQTEQMKSGMLKLDSQSAGLNGFQQKLQLVRKDLEATGKNVQAFLTKEFKYDNFELDNLKTELGKFQKRMTGFEQERKNKFGQLGQLQTQLRAALEMVRQSAAEVQNRSMELEKLHKSISTRVVPQKAPLLDKKFSEQQLGARQHPEFEDYRASDYESSVEQDDEDVFFYQKRNHGEEQQHQHRQTMHTSFNQQPNRMQTSTSLQLSMQGLHRKKQDQHNSSFENFTEEERSDQQKIEAHSAKIDRLIEMIQRGRRVMPLECEIDQTGYLKYKDTGTYIFSKDGNLFELNQTQLEEALQLRVIKL